MTNEHTGEEYLGKDRDELRAIIVERDIAIEQLHAAVKTVQELAATRLMEVERLREVLTIPNITPDTTSSALFIRTLSEHEKGQPVNGQDLINALMWRVRNQKREIAKLHEKRRSPEPLEQQPGTILKAFDVIRETMRDDPEYAWSWHCNIAMPIMDTAKVSHELANKAAAHLMQHLFAIDTRDNQHYQYRSAVKSQGASRDASSPCPSVHDHMWAADGHCMRCYAQRTGGVG